MGVLLLQKGQETSDFSILLRDLESSNNDIKLASRKVNYKYHVCDLDNILIG